MGVSAGDYDGDGRSDLFVTNGRGQVHGVFQSNPPDENDPSYTDVRTELGPDFAGSVGWGVTWADLDLDTDLDLFVRQRGHPGHRPGRGRRAARGLHATTGRQFVDASAASGLDDVGDLLARGSARPPTYDNDGDVDVAVSQIGGPLVLLQNRVSGKHWLEVALDGFHPGALVSVVLPDGRKLQREAQAGGQLPLVGGSTLSLWPWRRHGGQGARRALAGRGGNAPARREGESDRRGEGVRALAGVAVVLVALTAAGCALFGGSSSADSYLVPGCQRADLHGESVARVWDEALLDAIRRDTPAPTVHARNLFHTSAAMWDAWAAYDAGAEGYFVKEKLQADDIEAAREAAISYAAYRLLLHRYSVAAGLQETFDELTQTMQSLCYDIDFISTEGDSPAALGNRIAAKIIAYGRTDGAHEPHPLRTGRVRAGEPPARRGGARDDDDRPESLAAARARPERRPERARRSRGRCNRSSVRSGAT